MFLFGTGKKIQKKTKKQRIGHFFLFRTVLVCFFCLWLHLCCHSVFHNIFSFFCYFGLLFTIVFSTSYIPLRFEFVVAFFALLTYFVTHSQLLQQFRLFVHCHFLYTFLSSIFVFTQTSKRHSKLCPYPAYTRVSNN